MTYLSQGEKNVILGMVRLGIDSVPAQAYEFALECSKKIHGNWTVPEATDEVWNFMRGLWDSGASPLTWQGLLVVRFRLPVTHARAAMDAFLDFMMEDEDE